MIAALKMLEIFMQGVIVSRSRLLSPLESEMKIRQLNAWMYDLGNCHWL